MRSYQVEQCIPKSEQAKFSELKVLCSGAGFYLGTEYTNSEPIGFVEPGSRDTDYYETEAQADVSLAVMKYCHSLTPDVPELWIEFWRTIVNAMGLDPRGVGYRTTP